jgi:4-hydroxy-L-threonine phosphate dehydrogenase PdxA
MTKFYKNLNKIALTTGDQKGIGLEVAAKALADLKLNSKKSNSLVFLYRHLEQQSSQPQYFKLIDRHYARMTFENLTNALGFLNSLKSQSQLPKNCLIDLALTSSEAHWVFDSAVACASKKLTSMVTGPLSKAKSSELVGKPLGHTGIFRQLFPKTPMHMAFIGNSFNVLLATDHIALSEVESALKFGAFKTALSNSVHLRKLLNDRRKIGVLGLNPHSGEGGLIGKSEKVLFAKLNKRIFDGPLVPDAAFLKELRSKYSVLVCLYHDQGLIPFKAEHGQDSGVHVTTGLSFVRTSVDHGTAFDLYNKNLANHHSMRDAILLNLKLVGVKHA